MTDFTVTQITPHVSALSRQVEEAWRIKNFKGGILLNSKLEYNHGILPSLTTTDPRVQEQPPEISHHKADYHTYLEEKRKRWDEEEKEQDQEEQRNLKRRKIHNAAVKIYPKNTAKCRKRKVESETEKPPDDVQFTTTRDHKYSSVKKSKTSRNETHSGESSDANTIAVTSASQTTCLQPSNNHQPTEDPTPTITEVENQRSRVIQPEGIEKTDCHLPSMLKTQKKTIFNLRGYLHKKLEESPDPTDSTPISPDPIPKCSKSSSKPSPIPRKSRKRPKIITPSKSQPLISTFIFQQQRIPNPTPDGTPSAPGNISHSELSFCTSKTVENFEEL